MSKYEMEERLTDVLFNLEGVTEILGALHEAMENGEYKEGMILLHNVMEEQCEQLKGIVAAEEDKESEQLKGLVAVEEDGADRLNGVDRKNGVA